MKTNLITKLIIFLIKSYNLLISPILHPSCRFYPTCSKYAISALSKHGFPKGLWITIKRIARCHPFSAGGYDPI